MVHITSLANTGKQFINRIGIHNPLHSIKKYNSLPSSVTHYHHYHYHYSSIKRQQQHQHQQRFFTSTSTMTNSNKLRVALLQVSVTKDKNQNLSNARDQVKRAAENGSQFIVLPEMFQTPYSNDSFPVYAEYIDDSIVHTDTAVSIDADRSPSVYALQQMAKENNIWLVGGSISERDSEGRIYNTSVVFDPHGRCVAKHRKVHLFDIDVPGKQTFKESDTLTAGNEITVFDSPYGKVGLGICYDLRFPLLFQAMRQAGCSIFVLPGCFNLTTGSLHWEALLRARAIDYQCYMMAVSQARDENFSYKAWGHSTVVNPWGEVLATTEHHPDIVYADLELMKVDEARKFIPTSQQQRTDLYKCTSILDNSKNS